jgi:hypothetical protein
MISGGGGFAVVILLCFGISGGMVGRMKGGSFWTWFMISFCVPFIGLLTAVLYRFDNEELRRQCPNCGRVVKLYDAVCMGCSEELEFPETALASEAAMARKTA